MVKITNGVETFEVTRGALNSIYSKQGFKEVKESTKEVEDTEKDEVNEVDEDEEFAKGLLEKPISGWTKAEVKRFAEVKDIDISGTKNVTEAKEIIKATVIAE